MRLRDEVAFLDRADSMRPAHMRPEGEPARYHGNRAEHTQSADEGVHFIWCEVNLAFSFLPT